jgi:hypothetical protein
LVVLEAIVFSAQLLQLLVVLVLLVMAQQVAQVAQVVVALVVLMHQAEVLVQRIRVMQVATHR